MGSRVTSTSCGVISFSFIVWNPKFDLKFMMLQFVLLILLGKLVLATIKSQLCVPKVSKWVTFRDKYGWKKLRNN